MILSSIVILPVKPLQLQYFIENLEVKQTVFKDNNKMTKIKSIKLNIRNVPERYESEESWEKFLNDEKKKGKCIETHMQQDVDRSNNKDYVNTVYNFNFEDVKIKKSNINKGFIFETIEVMNPKNRHYIYVEDLFDLRDKCLFDYIDYCIELETRGQGVNEYFKTSLLMPIKIWKKIPHDNHEEIVEFLKYQKKSL